MQLLSEQEENITFDKIICRMIVDVWYSVTEYHIRMGIKDNQGNIANSIERSVNKLATMYIGMAPLTSMAAVIAEEKEKNILRVLLMSNVKPYEYLLGVGSYIWLACMLGAAIICAADSYRPQEGLAFMLIMAIGILASLLIGAAIGTWSKTQMMATSITVPVMMIFSFMPMLLMFNNTIAKAAKFIYSEQISIMLNQISALQIELSNICIITVNMLLFVALFTIAYKRCEFE